MIFLALLEAAMRYREGSYREEIDVYEKSIRDASDERYQLFVHAVENNPKNKGRKVDAGMKRRWERDYDRKKTNLVAVARGDAEKFNTIMYNELVGTVKRFTPQTQVAFDNYSTSYAVLMEEMVKAKNTTELLTVAKMYNNGDFDKTFEQVRELNKKQKEDEKNNANVANSDSNDGNELPQENSNADESAATTAEQPTANESVGHEQSGELQDGVVIELNGAERITDPDTTL